MSERIEIRHDGEVIASDLPVAKIPLSSCQSMLLVGEWFTETYFEEELQDLKEQADEANAWALGLAKAIDRFLDGKMTISELKDARDEYTAL